MKIEDAVLPTIKEYFATIGGAVDDEWKAQARKRLRDNTKARQKAAEARLTKLQTQQVALKAEVMNSISGDSTFDTDLLKEMMNDNKMAQIATEREIAECQEKVTKEESRIMTLSSQYKNIREWSEQFESAPVDTQKMILARLIERITVDRNYNIEIHFYVTPEDFSGTAAAS